MSAALTQEERALIRELRYGDGLSCREVARLIGRGPNTVRRHAPGRPGKVPVAPVRDIFERSGLSASEVARRLGWKSGAFPDASRVLRTLGLRDDVNGTTGAHTRRQHVDAETAGRIAEACGAQRWEVDS